MRLGATWRQARSHALAYDHGQASLAQLAMRGVTGPVPGFWTGPWTGLWLACGVLCGLVGWVGKVARLQL
eukprot:32055-Chlamydomonas_euryale.AAC.1